MQSQEVQVQLTNVLQLLALRHPSFQFGLANLIAWKDYNKWRVERALKARKAKKGKRWRHGRNLCG